jgi:hypothetical protein
MRAFLSLLLGTLLLAACSPKLDWREVKGDQATYSVLMPAKPSSFSRQVDLDGLQVMMTMTAAEADDATFAVGTAELADAAQVPHALAAMKTAMINNIRGSVRSEKHNGGFDIEAAGTAKGQAVVLYAHFVAQDKRVYQAIILGKENAIAPETQETFFTSFKTR